MIIERGSEVKNPGDEVECLGERSRRSLRCHHLFRFPFQEMKGVARRGRSEIAVHYNG